MAQYSLFSVDFDGSNDHALVADVLDFDHNEPFSVSVWFKTTDTNGYLVSKIDATPRGWGMHLDSNGELQFVLLTNGTTGVQVATTSGGFNTGTWTHGVVTYDGGGVAAGVTLYIDGVARAKDTPVFDNLAGATTVNAQALQINGRTGASVLITAQTDDVAIYDRELTAAEVLELYNVGQPVDFRLLSSAANLVGYWTMGDGDTFPNLRDRQVATPAANTGASVIDRSANSNDGTPTNMESTDFRSSLLAAELMPDLSGSGNPGTFTNMEDADFTTDVPGGRGSSWYSMLLDGTNEYVTMGDVLGFERTDAFSISCWFKSTDIAGSFVSKRDTVLGFNTGYSLGLASSAINLTLESSGSNRISVSTTLTFNDGAWHHVLVTYDGTSSASGVAIWVDGSLASVSVGSDTLSASILTSSNFNLGTNNDGTGAAFYAGNLDDVAVFDKELSSTEVASVYNSGVPVDVRALSSLSANLVGYWGCGDIGAGGVVRQIMHPDGVNEYITMGDVLDFERTDPFSVVVLIKNTTSGGYLVSKQNSAGNFEGWGFAYGPGTIGFTLRNTLANAISVSGNQTGFDDGNWHLAVVTYDGSSNANGVNFYKDAVIDGAPTINTNALSATTLTAFPLNIAARNGADSFFNSAIGFVGVYDKELSQAEVDEVWNNGIPPDLTLLTTYANLVGCWSGEASNTAVMTNQIAGDIEADTALFAVPGMELSPIGQQDGGPELGELIPAMTWTLTAGSPGGAIISYKMRALADPGPGFVVWVTVGEPDFAGTNAPAAIQGGTAIVADTWLS